MLRSTRRQRKDFKSCASVLPAGGPLPGPMSAHDSTGQNDDEGRREWFLDSLLLILYITQSTEVIKGLFHRADPKCPRTGISERTMRTRRVLVTALIFGLVTLSSIQAAEP